MWRWVVLVLLLAAGPAQHQTVTATTAPPTSAGTTTVAPAFTSAPQEDNVKLLVGPVLDELVKLCVASLRASTAHILKAFTERLDAFSGQQRKLEQAFDSFKSEMHDETTINEIRQKFSGQQRELGHRLDAIVKTQNLHEESFNSSQNQVQEQIEDLATEQEQLQVSVSDVVDQLPSMNSDLVSGQQAEFHASVRALLGEQATLWESSRSAAQQRIEQHESASKSRLDGLAQHLASVESRLQHLSHYLGYPCQSSGQCSEFVSNSTCGSDGLCACSVGFHRGDSVFQCDLTQIGDPCSADSDCHTANAECRGGTCRCPEGRWNRGNLECRARVGLNQPCSYQSDCSVADTSCVSGRCACHTRIVGDYEYRLGNGTTCKNGRVELRRSGGSWGYVCDDYFKAKSARVFCRSLGFSGGAAICCSKYGGTDNFHMDDVKCRGTESHLVSCPYSGWGTDDCGGSEVVSVQCG